MTLCSAFKKFILIPIYTSKWIFSASKTSTPVALRIISLSTFLQDFTINLNFNMPNSDYILQLVRTSNSLPILSLLQMYQDVTYVIHTFSNQMVQAMEHMKAEQRSEQFLSPVVNVNPLSWYQIPAKVIRSKREHCRRTQKVNWIGRQVGRYVCKPAFLV